MREGAFATFLGLVVKEKNDLLCDERRHWQAVAIGDSCLFHVRAGRLERAFPIECSGDFGNTPWLVGSRVPPCDALAQREVRAEGDCCTDDRLWLMTDALAKWFLEEHEAKARPWETLEPLLTGREARGRLRGLDRIPARRGGVAK